MPWEHFRRKTKCEKVGHDITGPDLAMGGWFVYRCTRCSFRFRADRIIQWHRER